MIETGANHEQQFLESLSYIDRVVAAIARRHALDRAEAEEFAAWARARLVDDDYAVFRKFGGRSSLTTYLTVVLANLFRDYRNARWGRWRPSAAAKRLGSTAMRLEELLYRDNLPRREAMNVLRSRDPSLDERKLARIVAEMPPHYPVREVGLDAQGVPPRLPVTAPPDAFDPPVVELERTVNQVMAELPAEDALLLRMRYWDELSVADIARTLGLEQKSLYRRLDAIGARLRKALEARGIDRRFIAEMLAPAEDR